MSYNANSKIKCAVVGCNAICNTIIYSDSLLDTLPKGKYILISMIYIIVSGRIDKLRIHKRYLHSKNIIGKM